MDVVQISTNPPGYLKEYYKRERRKLEIELGDECLVCGAKNSLEFHHVIPIFGRRPSGQLGRLTEWKKNKENLMLLCSKCHRELHTKID